MDQVKIWDVQSGPYTDLDPDGEEYYYNLCKIEVNGKVLSREYYFDSFDDAYEMVKYFHKNIEPIELEIDREIQLRITSGFRYEITLNINVDPNANFLELSGDNCDVIKDKVEDALYDLDDVIITECEVIQHVD